jgi:solute carrier family 25 carnitine/acylcarnitine transporter 20/29
MVSKVEQEEERLESGSGKVAKDLFAGAVGGVAQVLLGQPFDIVKVRLQTTSQYSGALNAATSIYQNEGALAFYKGTLTPLIGIGACVSVQFGGFNFARRYFEEQNKAKTGNAALSYSQYYAAGAFAGIANTALPRPSSTSVSVCRRSPAEQRVCTMGRSTACASSPHTRACWAACIVERQ